MNHLTQVGKWLVLFILISCSCSKPPVIELRSPLAANTHTLLLADYPLSNMPYHIESGDFWLVHTPEGQLLSFVPVSPEYAEHVSVDECRFAWSETVQRFIDPCSGDEWELDGRLNLANSTELWSSRDLDQYAITVENSMIYIHLDRMIPGASRQE